MLAVLERDNLFLVPLDSRREWYRYHHLFRDVLRIRLFSTNSAETIASLQRRAAIWFADEGLIDEAVRHYLVVGDRETAANLVEQHVQPALDREDWRTLAAWLDALPGDLLHTRPRLLLARAWVLQLGGQITQMSPLLDVAERLLDRGTTGLSGAEVLAVRGEIDLLRSAVLTRRGSGGEALAWSLRGRDRIPPHHAFARDWAELTRSEALRTAGNPRQAIATLQEALDDEASAPPTRSRILFAQAMPWLGMADLCQTERCARQVLGEVEPHRLPVTISWTQYLLGYVALEWRDLTTAGRWFERVVGSRDRAHLVALREAVFGLALTKGAQGDWVAAYHLIDRELGFAESVPAPHYVAPIRSLRARLALNQGDLATAAHWMNMVDLTRLQRRLLDVGSAPITTARVLIALGSAQALQQAARLLDEAVTTGEARYDVPLVLRALAVRSLVLDAQGERDAAVRVLQRALALAAPGQWLNTFVELGEPMRQLLTRVPLDDELGGYPATLLALFAATATASQARLTQRELDVLQLLGRRKSNKEIAQALSISVVTVKRHTVSLYEKLSVPSRRQAVARAQTLGLLAEPDAGEALIPN